jgi:hypothetical protein
MIHSAPKMLHEEKRRAALLSELAVGEANPAGFNELRGGRDVSVSHASFFPFYPRAPTRCFAESGTRRNAAPLLRSGGFNDCCSVL